MSYIKKPITAADHEALQCQPIYNRTLKVSAPICNFCGEKVPVFMYSNHNNVWRWLACNSCSVAIDANDWEIITVLLEQRFIKTFTAITGWKRSQFGRLPQQAVERFLDEFNRTVSKVQGDANAATE